MFFVFSAIFGYFCGVLDSRSRISLILVIVSAARAEVLGCQSFRSVKSLV